MLAARPVTPRVPTSYSASTPAPLLILLHGHGMTGAEQDEYLGLGTVATARGLLYVAPDGTANSGGDQFWNATDACCSPGINVDDSAYLTAVIADVKARYNVDPRRVYIVGHSNGGFMAFRMACDHADKVAAIVSIAGATWSKAQAKRCQPTESVATLQVHGKADQVIKYNGGAIEGVRYPSAVTTLETWARANGCHLTPDRPAPEPGTLEVGRPPATARAYSTGCVGNGHSELWTQPGGEHVPPFVPTFADQLVDFLLAHPKE